MKAKEVIEALKQFDPESTVDVQCWGYYYPIKEIDKIETEDNAVVIRLNEKD